MRFGEIFGKSWNEYKQNFRVFLIIFLLLFVIPSLIQFFVSIPSSLEIIELGSEPEPSEILGVIFSFKYLIVLIFSIILFLLGVWMSASFIYNSLYRKKEMSIKETLTGGKKYLWRFLAFSIVYGLFLIGLFLLLIIPGIIFMVFWIFAAFVFIGENKPILESLKISHNIVKSRWWRTFGFSLLFLLIVILVSWVFGIIAGIINVAVGFPYIWGAFSEVGVEAISTGNLNVFVPNHILFIMAFVKQIFQLGASLITVPLTVLFFKNFYLDMKSQKGKKPREKK